MNGKYDALCLFPSEVGVLHAFAFQCVDIVTVTTNQETVGGRKEHRKIDIEEVRKSVNMLKRGKSAGHDGITAEMLQNMNTEYMEMFSTLVNKAREEKQVPDDWREGKVIPVFKKGDTTDCNNYRGIMLLSIPCKIVDYLKFGFIPSLPDKQSPMSLLCNEVLGNDAMKPSKLQDHLTRCHPDKTEKDLKYFQTQK
ncbi:unnamed protein product [Acanthoscelides obtectus]|uniref:Reverse transcriptase domain-containing protein n=1 Tax=Acanthoscelides obtectus TaxID=200917 RepID=A0A9P0KVV3_ACAOB|nr:unnamed protein product [Acanthoscelides obtectus]CAK1654551.1 Protein FAM200B [Acanthoscelides obtectus]